MHCTRTAEAAGRRLEGEGEPLYLPQQMPEGHGLLEAARYANPHGGPVRQTNRGRVQGGNAWCASKRDRATRDACQTGSTAGSLTITFCARNQNTTESRWKKRLEVATGGDLA